MKDNISYRKLLTLTQVLILLIAGNFQVIAQQDGDLDTDFNIGTGANGTINAMAIQADGKILIAGQFTSYNGTTRNRVARLNTNGSLDTSFDPGIGPDLSVETIFIQADGKILIGGFFTFFNNSPQNRIARLNSDGSIDNTFDIGTGPGGVVYSIHANSAGKIVIGGGFITYNSTSINRIAVINSNGSLDTDFNPDTGANALVFDCKFLPDGKIIAAGTFTQFNGTASVYVAKVNADGSLDANFTSGIATASSGFVRTITPLSNGKFIIRGHYTVNNLSNDHISRINTNGSVDNTFESRVSIRHGLLADGQIINYTFGTLSRLYDYGGTDAGFNNGNVIELFTIHEQSDGKIIIAGAFTTYNGVARNRIARIHSRRLAAEPTAQPFDISFTDIEASSLKISFEGASGNPSGYIALRKKTSNIITFPKDGISYTKGQALDDAVVAYIGSDLSFEDNPLDTCGNYFYKIFAFNTAAERRINYLQNNPLSATQQTLSVEPREGQLNHCINFGSGTPGSINTAAIQDDGKIIIGGTFMNFNGIARSNIARLNADGSLDTGFYPENGTSGSISQIQIQPDGKVIIAGSFTFVGGAFRNRIVRLTPDGALDGTFNPGTGTNNEVLSMALQPDGKIIIGGIFTSYNDSPRNFITRINADGSVDNTFNIGTGADGAINTISVQPDGKIIIGGFFNNYNGVSRIRIARLNSNGSLDQTFVPNAGANGNVFSSAVQADGKIIIGGEFTFYNNIQINRVARLNPDGSLDNTFQIGSGANGSIRKILLAHDGRIILGGNFTIFNGTTKVRMVRLNTDGRIHNRFNPGIGANGEIRSMAFRADGSVVIVGNFSSYNSTPRNRIAVVHAFKLSLAAAPTAQATELSISDISKDSFKASFKAATGNVTGYIATLTKNYYPDIFPEGGDTYSVNEVIGKTENQDVIVKHLGSETSFTVSNLSPCTAYYLHIYTYNGSGQNINYLAVNPLKDYVVTLPETQTAEDGQAETGPCFNIGTGFNGTVNAVAVQQDGKIIVGGSFLFYNGTSINRLARINVDGSLDTSFKPGTGPNLTVWSMVVLTNGKIVIGGDFNTYNGSTRGGVAQLNSDGTLDDSFNPGSGTALTGSVYTLLAQADNKIIIGGSFTSYNGNVQSGIARINSNGSIDNSFNIGGGANGMIRSIKEQSDGKIIIAGDFTTFNQAQRGRIARLDKDGSVDTSFNPGIGANSAVYGMEIQSDDQIIIVGSFTNYGTAVRNRIARIRPDASLDNSFAPGTAAENSIFSIAAQADGKILIGGQFVSYNGTARNRLARLYDDGTLDLQFSPGTGANESIQTLVSTENDKIIIGGNFISYNGDNINRFAKIHSTNFVIAPEPTSQPINLTFSEVTPSSMKLDWTATAQVRGFIVLRKKGSAITALPQDGKFYAISEQIGDAQVVHIGPENTITQSNLEQNAVYFFKIFAYNGSGLSTNYLLENPLTGSQQATDITPPQFTSNSTPIETEPGKEILVSVVISDPESGVSSAKISFGPANSSTFSSINLDMNNASGNIWNFTIPASSASELGVRYQIIATNGIGLQATLGPLRVVVNITNQGLTIPYSSFGKKASNYQIIAIPLNLQNKTVNGVFGNTLGNYGDPGKWKIYHYSGGQTKELSGLSAIEQGKGYWLIIKDKADLLTGPGKTNGSIDDPFKMNLANGWNQVGNPYGFNIAWEDIINANPNWEIGQLRVFKNGKFENADRLNTFEGGFVFVNEGTGPFTFPAEKKSSVNGREDNTEPSNDIIRTSLDNEKWEVRFTLKSGKSTNDLAGFGMHPEAKDGFDKFDDFALPRFIDYIDLRHHKSIHNTSFSRDFVKTSENHIWSFEINSSNSRQLSELSWDNSYFDNNAKHLLLWDENLRRSIDMSEINLYSFSTPGKFKVLYGSWQFIQEQLSSFNFTFYDPFPNPSSGLLNLQFILPQSIAGYDVSIDFRDLTGTKSGIITQGKFDAGLNKTIWNINASDNGTLPNGIYIIRLSVNEISLYKKVVIIR